MDKRRIAYVVNHVAFFVSHRLPLAVGAVKAGLEVGLYTGQAGNAEMEAAAVARLSDAKLNHRRVAFRSAGLNPIVELIGLIQLIWFLYKFKPNIVHCASPKGVLYGGIAARICRVPALVLAISGMGYAYTDVEGGGLIRRLVRRIYSVMARFAFLHPNVRIIVQNEDDKQAVLATGCVHASTVKLIPGSGVDLSLFTACDPSQKAKIVLLPARMLIDKGVQEFVAVARLLKVDMPEWRFVLAGAAGYDNPSAIPKEDLLAWQSEGAIEWLGHIDDMMRLYRDAAIVCLPSYREGMPKALLEAAAAGCAVITTDVPGCREAIVPNRTGVLVPMRDTAALYSNLLSLINDNDRTRSYGAKGQMLAADRFSLNSVVNQTIILYKELLANDG